MPEPHVGAGEADLRSQPSTSDAVQSSVADRGAVVRGSRPQAPTTTCTVAIPVYNRRAMVMRAVDSALDQSVSSLEVLVVDNCSTDGTWESLNSITDPRVRLVRNDQNVGLFGNFNRCLDLASGEYLRFLCSDDLLAPDCLRSEIRSMEAHPSAVLLTTSARRISSSGRLLGLHAHHLPAGVYPSEAAIAGVLRFLAEYAYNPLNYPSGILLRTAAARSAGYFDTDMRMAADLDLFLRVLASGDLLVVDQRGCDITIHESQVGAQLEGKAVVIAEEYVLLERHGAALGSDEAKRRVADDLAGLCLRFALGAWTRGDSRTAREHVALARVHGATVPAMISGLSRIMAARIRLKLAGGLLAWDVPSTPA